MDQVGVGGSGHFFCWARTPWDIFACSPYNPFPSVGGSMLCSEFGKILQLALEPSMVCRIYPKLSGRERNPSTGKSLVHFPALVDDSHLSPFYRPSLHGQGYFNWDCYRCYPLPSLSSKFLRTLFSTVRKDNKRKGGWKRGCSESISPDRNGAS